MNLVGNDGESEPWKSFWIFMYVRTAEGTTSDSLVYLFGCFVFYWGGGKGDSFRGEEFCINFVGTLTNIIRCLCDFGAISTYCK